jgi:hypothetical protein
VREKERQRERGQTLKKSTSGIPEEYLRNTKGIT